MTASIAYSTTAFDAYLQQSTFPKPATETDLIHIHFGAGRLGLGLIAPFFRKSGSRLYLLNRAMSGNRPTGSTALSPERRNQLLRENPGRYYVLQKPGGGPADLQTVHYDGFFEYDEHNVAELIHSILAQPARGRSAVVVTASVLKAENYGPVVSALNAIAGLMQGGSNSIDRLFLVACENTVSAYDIFRDEHLRTALTPEARERVTCVHALVDRMCVDLEEGGMGARPVVLVRAEEYGSVKLELNEETEELVDLCRGTRIEFSQHVDTEKQIKSWLLNGTHWLVALNAFQDEHGDKAFKLNEFLSKKPENARFAARVLAEMREGVAAILRRSPQYEGFVNDVDIEDYLDRAADAILRRFSGTEDPITRILARFQKPTTKDCTTVIAFSKRFADRVDEPMRAYEEEHGAPPPAASHSIQSLFRLVASGTFIDAKSL